MIERNVVYTIAELVDFIDRARLPLAEAPAPQPPLGAEFPETRPSGDEEAAEMDDDILDDATPSDDGCAVAGDLDPRQDGDTMAFCAALDHSDTDNGLRLRTYFGDDILVMEQHGIAGGDWLVWTGKHWDLAAGPARVANLGQRIGGLIARETDFLAATPRERTAIDAGDGAAAELKVVEAGAEKSDADRAKIRQLKATAAIGDAARAALGARKQARRKFGVSSKNMGRVENMLKAAASHMRKPADAFNRDSYKIATLTHTIRLVKEPDPECPDPDVERLVWRVRATEGHDRSDLITALVPVAYDADARPRKWQAFLDRFMPSPAQDDKRRTLQQYCGLGLTGLVVQYVMYHYGLGANGKSVFLETLMRLLGESFAVSLPPETLIGTGERSAGGAAPDIIRLLGKRMLRVPEVKPGAQLQEDLIKRITGGEQITARTLFKGYVDFQNKAKPHMSGNGFPNINSTDHGIWRRMLVMHWTETIAAGEQKNFEDVVRDLLTEAPAILNWMIEGALDYLNNGFFIAEDVRQATESYRDDMDVVGQFARDCIAPAPGEHVQARVAYEAFVTWCKANNRRAVFETRFGRDMKQKFTAGRYGTARLNAYMDVRLHDVPTAQADDAPPDPDPNDREVPM